MSEDKTVEIRSRDYWFKIVEFLQQNWALIDEDQPALRARCSSSGTHPACSIGCGFRPSPRRRSRCFGTGSSGTTPTEGAGVHREAGAAVLGVEASEWGDLFVGEVLEVAGCRAGTLRRLEDDGAARPRRLREPS